MTMLGLCGLADCVWAMTPLAATKPETARTLIAALRTLAPRSIGFYHSEIGLTGAGLGRSKLIGKKESFALQVDRSRSSKTWARANKAFSDPSAKTRARTGME